MHPKRSQIVRVGARNHLNIIDLLHGFEIAAHGYFSPQMAELQTTGDWGEMSTEACEGQNKNAVFALQ